MGWKWVQQDWAHKTLPVVALLQIISVKRLQDVICTGEADKIWEHPNLILAPLYIHWEYSLKSSSDYTTLPCLNLFKAFSTFGIKSPNFILASMSLDSTGLQVWPPFPPSRPYMFSVLPTYHDLPPVIVLFTLLLLPGALLSPSTPN